MTSVRKNLTSHPQRFLGLELLGAKNNKTALCVLEYFPKEKKLFLLDCYDRIFQENEQTSDEALLALIREISDPFHQGQIHMGVNVPLSLPPCVTCTKIKCPMPSHCQVPEVKWMREFSRKHQLKNDFTPYTQRPIELWMKQKTLTHESLSFSVDETLGGNKAPLTARMVFLKRHLKNMKLSEVLPKWSVLHLQKPLNLKQRSLVRYRSLEEGAHFREEILHQLIEAFGLFIYERDFKKVSLSLSSFDALLCALSVWLEDTHQVEPLSKSFPKKSGWITTPLIKGTPKGIMK